MPCWLTMGAGRWAQRGEISGAPPPLQLPSSPDPLGTSFRHQATALLGNLSPLSLGQQVKLKQVIPLTEEEKTEHGVAAERRRMRLVYADTIKDLLSHCAIQDGECGCVHKTGAGCTQEDSRCPPTSFEWKEEEIPYGPLSLVASGSSGLLGLKTSSRGGRCWGRSLTARKQRRWSGWVLLESPSHTVHLGLWRCVG